MGFYTPTSISAAYVSNQRTKEGDYKWDQAFGKVGLQQQAALHNLNNQYSKTINSAYSNYLMANRGIRGSFMGQGYKDAYKQMTQEGLQAEIAQSNLTMREIRQQLAQSSQSVLSDISAAQQLEIANLDRAAGSAKAYLDYLGTLSNRQDMTKGYLSDDQKKLTIDDMYDTIFNVQPNIGSGENGFVDEKGNPAMNYINWLEANRKDNDADRMWFRWLFEQGGFGQFREMTKKGIKKD